MQDDNNLHTRLNPQQQDTNEPYHANYQNQPQHIYPQFQSNPQQTYPSYNPQAAYHPYPDQHRQGQYVAPVQYPSNSLQDALSVITMRINTQFGCYMCLVYFELILAIISLILTIVSSSKAHESELLITDVLLTLPLLIGCIVAIQAKSSLSKSRQYAAFVLFIIATVVSFALSVMVGVWAGWVPGSIIGLAVRSFIGLYLIFGSYSLYQLMRDRDSIMAREGINLYDPVIRA